MKNKTLRIISLILLIFIATTAVFADDGEIFRKNVSKTPHEETEHAALKMLPVYVPAQSSDGTLLTDGIEYYNADGTLVETRLEARPLIGFYTDGPVEHIDDPLYGGFPGHGQRDAYAVVSLDDGATWSRTNLSNSADLSSFKIRLGGRQKVAYPGDVGRTFIASDGNQVLAVWVSRYAGGGSPNYAMTADERSAVADHLVATRMIDDASVCTDDYDDSGRITTDPADSPCLYLEDHFGVAGSQGSSDLADEGLPLVGELPYAAVWVARGVLLPPAATGLETSTFVWFKAERLSSAVRDANRPEVACAKGAGCTITWQEDPDGIRPGEGEGPGEGWSGAIAHHQTDTWYSYISWNDFSLVGGDGDGDNKVDYGIVYDGSTAGFTSLIAWLADNPDSGRPQAAIPMAIPVRLTDNAMCVEVDAEGNFDNPYCYMDFNGNETADFCADSVTVTIEVPDTETGVATDHDVNMCITEDGRLLRGNTASTRARINLHEYSTSVAIQPGEQDADFFNAIDSAWFTMSYEENKGLGECEDEETLADPNICDTADFVDKIDMGKNAWYHTFDMFNPELVSQGLMLNQPAVYPIDWADGSELLTQDTSLGYNFYQITDDPIYDTQAALGTTILYQTEISRRPSPITQDWYLAGTTGRVAFQLWKQGIIRRGGPADIMGRAFIIPDDFDSTVDNPYAYENMECLHGDGSDAWAFRTDLSQIANPRYVKGLCAAPADNVSANTIVDGDTADGSEVDIGTVTCDDISCLVSSFPFSLYFDDVAGGEPIPSIFEWVQTGPGYGITITDPTLTNFDDPTWENPYDVAKGHRGFLQGDMLMVMYAWSPNWKANTVGHDNYNLYNRRSFDGGQSWSTLPASFTHTNGVTYSGDGTTTCEWYYTDSQFADLTYTDVTGNEFAICTDYAAGAFEQARNVSQLLGTHETILDPRYSPATPSITTDSVTTYSLPVGFTAPYKDPSLEINDIQDPSRYFMVYETGDNTTTAVGEAEPLDLFYSRAVNWGDDYLVWAEETDLSTCLPDASIEDDVLIGTGFCNEFDALEGSQFSESGEASVTTNPDTTFFYAIWNQVDFGVDGLSEDSDAWFRRVLFIDDYIPTDDGGTGPGNTAPGGPGISSPSEGAVFPTDAVIQFSATASDLEDGDLSASIVWTLGETELYTGASFTGVFSPGTHTVTATVTDSGGLSASSSVTFTVEEPTQPPDPEIEMSVGLEVDPAIVTKGDTVLVEVFVTDENGVVENANVEVSIAFPKINVDLSATTDAHGYASVSYKLNTNKTGTGPALVIATVTKEGYQPASGESTFTVQ